MLFTRCQVSSCWNMSIYICVFNRQPYHACSTKKSCLTRLLNENHHTSSEYLSSTDYSVIITTEKLFLGLIVRELQVIRTQKFCCGSSIYKNIRKCKDTYRRNPLYTLSSTINWFFNRMHSILIALSNGLTISIKVFEHHRALDLCKVLSYFTLWFKKLSGSMLFNY